MESLKQFEKIYDDIEQILKNSVWLQAAFNAQVSEVTDDQLREISKYIKQHENTTNRGISRTILVVLKPFKEHSIIKLQYELFSSKLKNHEEI